MSPVIIAIKVKQTLSFFGARFSGLPPDGVCGLVRPERETVFLLFSCLVEHAEDVPQNSVPFELKLLKNHDLFATRLKLVAAIFGKLGQVAIGIAPAQLK